MAIIIALISGVLFGFGLIIAGMSNPQKILGFLDISGNWDPSLLITMAVAMAISAVAFFIAKKRQNTFLGDKMVLPTHSQIDKSLVIGSLLFGVGWGLAGICPGPGILLAGAGYMKGVTFLVSMIFGMMIHTKLNIKK